jgi:hypothetical protein
VSSYNGLLIVYFFENLVVIFSLFNEIFELVIKNPVTDGDVINVCEFLCTDIHSEFVGIKVPNFNRFIFTTASKNISLSCHL